MRTKTRRVLIALAAAACVLIWALARRPPSAPRIDALETSAVDPANDDRQATEGLTGDHAPPGPRSSPDRPALDRRQAFELGKRLFLPRPSATATSGAGDAAPVTHHPRTLMPGANGLVDRRPDGGADWPLLKSELEKRMTEVRTSTAHCLDGWAQEDPSLAAGVMLALSVDEQGLDQVWIMDRDEAPSGPLACLSNAVYPIDWSGLTKQKMRLTVKIRYAPADAGPPD
ncbi:MAG TPA: hypothetical protein VK989_10465 [Polyangia bacterium]|jgi:hypothetical protein|nr:hypothetical protein [Polyangia bacterium]